MSTPKQHLIEVSPPTVHAVRVAGSTIEFYRACPLDQKPALDELLAAWTEGAAVRASTLISCSSVRWHLATREEAQRHRTIDALRKFASDTARDATGPFDIIGCNADDGHPLAGSGSQRWLLGAAPSEAVEPVLAAAKERGLDGSRPGSATLARIGGIVAALRVAGNGQVLLWDVGPDRSHAILITGRGVEAVTACPIGFDALCGIIQAALGLKFRAAAARLFFNDSYDFGEAAPKIAAEIAPALKPALAAVAGNVGTALACTGLTPKQSWLAAELGRVLGLPMWAPDVAKTVVAWKLQLAANLIPAFSTEALGLVRLAATTPPPKDWYPVWVRATAETAETMAKPAEKSAASAPVVVATTAKSPAAAEKAPPPPAPVAAKPAPTPAAAKAATASKPAPASPTKPEQKPAPAPVRPLTGDSKPGSKSIVKAAAEKTPPATATGKPGSRPPVELVVSYPPHEKKRPNYALYGGIAAGLVFAAVATKFYFDAQSAKATVEREKTAAAEQVKQAEARQHQVELQAKAEAERIRKEAEAAREAAVALARQQAEEQTRIKVSAAVEAERIALSPGILIVTTSPAGADVSIDGGAKRKAPLSLNDIAPGAHQIGISLPGYDPVTLEAEIKGTKTTDLGMIQLQRATGTLVVTSTPDAVDFTVRPGGADAKAPALRTGRTPAQFADLPPGDYVVTFSRDGWADHNEKVTVAKRQSVQVATKFTDGVVIVTSSPAGATVKRDGVALGVTPLTLNGVSPGRVNYDLSLTGYDPITVTGNVAEGQQVKLNAPLPSLDRIASTAEVKTPPKPFSTPAPRLPMMQRNDDHLQVNVSFVVNRDGTLRDIQTVGKVDRQLGKTCIEAISKWKFQPAMGYDGRPLNVRVSVPITFLTQDS